MNPRFTSLGSFAAGLLFGVGLMLGGMLDPARIIGFLSFAGTWDPTLGFVMAGAIPVHALGRYLLRGRSVLCSDGQPATAARRVDGRLVLGSVLFGAGWGLSGYCPGPMIVALGAAPWLALAPFVALLAGLALPRLFERLPTSRS